MKLTQIINTKELEGKVKIGETKKLEHNYYDFASEEENKRFRDSAIEIFAPEGARFFRVTEINPVNEYTRVVQVEYYS